MATYFVDDGGTPTAPYDTWAKAAASIQALDTAVTLAADDIIYIGADANCTEAGAAITLTGAANAALPVYVISSTVGSGSDVSYSVGTGAQITTGAGAYDFALNDSFALYGIRCVLGRNLNIASSTLEGCSFYGCDIEFGSGGALSSGGGSRTVFDGCTLDFSADSGATATAAVTSTGYPLIFRDCNFAGGGNRTGTIFATTTNSGLLHASGCDFSSFSNATDCEIVSTTDLSGVVQLSNCTTKASPTLVTTALPRSGWVLITNTGPDDQPQQLVYADRKGSVTSTAIYRTGGSDIESANSAWLVTTTAQSAEGAPFYTPWMYGTVSSTGSKTFDCYITNDTADFDDSQVWLEVEYLATADDAQWTLVTDQRATITTTAAAQTDDTGSTWNGTGPSFTYKQKLSCASVSVGESGQYRARVAVGLASIASSRYFYVDCKTNVS